MRIQLTSGLDISDPTRSSKSFKQLIDKYRPSLDSYEDIRKCIHQHPELSRMESKTADLIEHHIEKLKCYKIHSKIGGHGLAAVLENKPGPTVLLRADMDALPVKEQTNLPYASNVVMEDYDGNVQPVMHACGHDVHVTCLLAAAETFAASRKEWTGTLILVFQPDEEKTGGARRMVDDGLYDKIAVPDVVLGQHVFPGRAGRLGLRKGIMLAASDSLQVTFHGRGGHASMPQKVIDPVVMAAFAITRLQTIVSREIAPGDEMAVVTVAKLQASNAENIISSEATISVNVRTVDLDVRERVLSAIKRIVKAESDASGASKEPTINIISSFPVTVNDETLTGKISDTFDTLFGKDFDAETPRVSGSEDFSVLATAVDRPSCFWFVAGTDPSTWDEAERNGTVSQDIPVNHSPFFAPVMQPTLRVGTDALVSAALTFLDTGLKRAGDVIEG